MNRNMLAEKYIHGVGIEVGAGHFPWPNPNDAAIKYVDRYTKDQLWDHFPPAQRASIPETTIVADGFKPLPDIKPSSLDFVVNSHVLEHTARPVDALNTWLSYLKPGGFLVMAIPDKNECFDRPRRCTDWYDLTQTPVDAFKLRQYYDWFETIEQLHDERLQERVFLAQQNDEHIHFCVWDTATMADFFNRYVTSADCEQAEFHHAGHEFFVVLQRL